ncbi:hypothetical protein WDU94_005817 [Cyamophila willieti]
MPTPFEREKAKKKKKKKKKKEKEVDETMENYIGLSPTLTPLHQGVVTYACVHCRLFSTYDIDSMIEHCKTCEAMPRPNKYKFKYVCNQCTYGAYQVASIKAHIFSHTGEKPFACSYCEYACANKSSLYKHMREKHTHAIIRESV